MLCLGIETSCDDTGLALARDGKIIDSVLASQASLHELFGGVVPELASREHQRLLGPLFDLLLKRNGIIKQDIDVIAVARGPGLLGSLLVGAGFAKALAFGLDRPLIGVNHLHAHLLSCGIENPLEFPALGLVISGGHTELYHMRSPWNMERKGRTLDDACGEAFDKVGATLGLGYPAGGKIEKHALQGNAAACHLSAPYLDNSNLDFSFSGLKTMAITRARTAHIPDDNDPDKLADFCAGFSQTIVQALVEKTARAMQRFPHARILYLAGGVAANFHIRKALGEMMEKLGGKLYAPSTPLCMDNGAMIAFAGHLLAKAGFYHALDLEAIPRGREIPDDMLRMKCDE